MTTYSKSGSFGWAGGGKAGAIVDMWLASRFSSQPSQNQAPPSGSPDAGPVTTGPEYGNPGAFTVSDIATIADYYIRVQYGGQTYWSACSANDLTGAPVASGVSEVLGDETSIHVVNNTTTPTVSLLAGTGDVTWSAGSTATTLKNTGPGTTGPIGSTTTVPVVSIDAQGRVTALTSASLSTYAPLASPALTGTPTAPTQTFGDSSTKIATDTFVAAAVATPAGVPSGRMYTTSATTIANNSTVPITGMVQDYVRGGVTFSSGGNSLTIPTTGVYHITVGIGSMNLTANGTLPSGSMEVIPVLNGSVVLGRSSAPCASNWPAAVWSDQRDLSAGAVLTLAGAQSSGSTAFADPNNGNQLPSWVSVALVTI